MESINKCQILRIFLRIYFINRRRRAIMAFSKVLNSIWVDELMVFLSCHEGEKVDKSFWSRCRGVFHRLINTMSARPKLFFFMKIYRTAWFIHSKFSYNFIVFLRSSGTKRFPPFFDNRNTTIKLLSEKDQGIRSRIPFITSYIYKTTENHNILHT